jgi:hypothetical protein
MLNMPSNQKPVRIGTRMRPDLRNRLAGFCAASGLSESAVISSGVEQYLDGTGDLTLLPRRLDRFDRALGRMHRDQQLFMQAFGVFVRLWFAHTPAVAEEDKAEARAKAEARYKRFVEHVSEQFAGGRRFLDDLPKEVISDDEELDAIVANAVDGATEGD